MNTTALQTAQPSGLANVYDVYILTSGNAVLHYDILFTYYSPQADVRKTPTAPPESNDDRQLENNQSEERVIPSAPLLPEEDGVGASQASSGVNVTSPSLLVEASTKASPAVSDDAGVMAAIFAMEKRMMDVIQNQWRQMYLITADRERKKYEEKIQSLEEVQWLYVHRLPN